MSFDLPEESSSLYRYVRQLDRHVTRLRHKAVSRQSVVGFKWLLLMFLRIIPALAVVIFLIQRTQTRYVLLTGPAGSTTARLAPRLQTILNEPAPIERFLHLNVVPDFELRPSCGALDTIDRYFNMEFLWQDLSAADPISPFPPFSAAHCHLLQLPCAAHSLRTAWIS